MDVDADIKKKTKHNKANDFNNLFMPCNFSRCSLCHNITHAYIRVTLKTKLKPLTYNLCIYISTFYWRLRNKFETLRFNKII